MVIKVRAIRPKKLPATVKVADLLARELGQNGFAGDVVTFMAFYPHQLKSVYVRTGNLGRHWRMSGVKTNSKRMYAEATNNVPYVGPVQGRFKPKEPTQAREMQRRGWRGIDLAVAKLWPKHRHNLIRIITQKDPRVQERRKLAASGLRGSGGR